MDAAIASPGAGNLRRTFDFVITYHQLVVYDEGTVPMPDNDWTKRHIAQGFS